MTEAVWFMIGAVFAVMVMGTIQLALMYLDFHQRTRRKP